MMQPPQRQLCLPGALQEGPRWQKWAWRAKWLELAWFPLVCTADLQLSEQSWDVWISLLCQCL